MQLDKNTSGVIEISSYSQNFQINMCLLVCFVYSETSFLCVALTALELTLQTMLALKSEIHLLLSPMCWD